MGVTCDARSARGCHALELPFVFDPLHLSGVDRFVGAVGGRPLEPAQMMDVWSTFARTGDPGWPAYDAAGRTTMVFGAESRLKDAPLEEERGPLGYRPGATPLK